MLFRSAYRIYNKRTQKIEESVHVVFLENNKEEPSEDDISERFKTLELGESSKTDLVEKAPIINLEYESDDEQPARPNNNKMTLRHDEEFPIRNDLETPDDCHLKVSEKQLSDSDRCNSRNQDTGSVSIRVGDSTQSQAEHIGDTMEGVETHHSVRDPKDLAPIKRILRDHPPNAIFGGLDQGRLTRKGLAEKVSSLYGCFLS